MRNASNGTKRRRRFPVLVLVVIAASAAMRAQSIPSNASDAITCRALEVKVSRKFGIRLVVFHYRDAADRSRLGKLLREHDGSSVEFRVGDEQWHPATVLRLKTCFGRGLLLFPLSSPPVTEGESFLLRFPHDPDPSSTDGVPQRL
ncbi:MAG: hypothetical protein ACRD2B_01835 [Terriglobia bacterium]